MLPAGNEAMAKENEKSSRKLVGLMHKQDQLFRGILDLKETLYYFW